MIRRAPVGRDEEERSRGREGSSRISDIGKDLGLCPRGRDSTFLKQPLGSSNGAGQSWATALKRDTLLLSARNSNCASCGVGTGEFVTAAIGSGAEGGLDLWVWVFMHAGPSLSLPCCWGGRGSIEAVPKLGDRRPPPDTVIVAVTTHFLSPFCHLPCEVLLAHQRSQCCAPPRWPAVDAAGALPHHTMLSSTRAWLMCSSLGSPPPARGSSEAPSCKPQESMTAPCG